MTKRICVVANKWFEIDPLVAALSNASARPVGYSDIQFVRWSSELVGSPPSSAKPRAVLHAEEFSIEFWCVQDMMDPSVAGSYSNTEEKWRILPKAFLKVRDDPVEFVVAFGTAASLPDGPSCNGSVTVGPRVFIHNPYASNAAASPSKWGYPEVTDRVLPSTLGQSFFDLLAARPDFPSEPQSRFLAPFGNPATERILQVDALAVAVSSVNVVDPTQYPKTDPAALSAALASGAEPLVSFESTHGIIRLQSEAPFLFVSGITNRMGHFSDEAGAHAYSQNFVAAHNAGVALAWMMPSIVHFVSRSTR